MPLRPSRSATSRSDSGWTSLDDSLDNFPAYPQLGPSDEIQDYQAFQHSMPPDEFRQEWSAAIQLPAGATSDQCHQSFAQPGVGQDAQQLGYTAHSGFLHLPLHFRTAWNFAGSSFNTVQNTMSYSNTNSPGDLFPYSEDEAGPSYAMGTEPQPITLTESGEHTGDPQVLSAQKEECPVFEHVSDQSTSDQPRHWTILPQRPYENGLKRSDGNDDTLVPFNILLNDLNPKLPPGAAVPPHLQEPALLLKPRKNKKCTVRFRFEGCVPYDSKQYNEYYCGKPATLQKIGHIVYEVFEVFMTKTAGAPLSYNNRKVDIDHIVLVHISRPSVGTIQPEFGIADEFRDLYTDP